MASCLVNPPPQSSGAGAHGERSGTNESARPSAPAWMDRKRRSVEFVCDKIWTEEGGDEWVPVATSRMLV